LICRSISPSAVFLYDTLLHTLAVQRFYFYLESYGRQWFPLLPFLPHTFACHFLAQSSVSGAGDAGALMHFGTASGNINTNNDMWMFVVVVVCVFRRHAES
jgi:hypothetical protein